MPLNSGARTVNCLGWVRACVALLPARPRSSWLLLKQTEVGCTSPLGQRTGPGEDLLCGSFLPPAPVVTPIVLVV